MLNYEFMPWVRRGLARAHANQQVLGMPVLPTVKVGLQLKGTAPDAAASAAIDLKMLGPADVIGIDPRCIVRTEPRANNHDFEPNYLAAIEFDPPDLPWLFTPAHANAQQRLLPWLLLLVFRRDEIDEPRLLPARLLPSIKLPTDRPVPLPDLSEAWMWAHAQVLRSPAVDPADMAQALKDRPAKNLSRLVCARRLEAGKSYIACVVPLFAQGCKAGLGQPVPDAELLSPAWVGTQAPGLELPVYYHWHFSTGPAGDFETLARRLKTTKEQSAEVQAQLSALGRVPVEVDADRLLQEPVIRAQGLAAMNAAYKAQYEGAMLSLSSTAPAEPGEAAAIASDMAAIINAGEQRALGNLALEDEEPEVPLVGPPFYGAWHARAHRVDPLLRERWLHHLNLSAPRRMAAGVGTRLVQTHQEVFMQACWQQMGEVLKTQRMLSLAHLSARSLARIVKRLDRMPPERRLQFLGPALGRLKSAGQPAPGLTLWGYLRSTSLPDAAADGALRRSLGAGRGWMKRAEALPAAGLATQMTRGFARVEGVRAQIEVARFRLDGIASLKALDGLALQNTGLEMFDVPGLGTGIPAQALLGLAERQRGLRQSLVPGAFASPSVSHKLKAGVLLDSHWQRIDEMSAAIAAAPVVDAAGGAAALHDAPGALAMASALLTAAQGAVQRQTEGLLLSAVKDERGFGLAPAQALKVDARSGAISVARARTPLRGEPVPRGPAMKAGTLGTVPIDAIRRHGNSALFGSLSAGALSAVAGAVPGGPQPAAAVPLSAGLDGRFVPRAEVELNVLAPALADGARISITLLPPVHEEATLARFRRAWAGRLEREATVPLPQAFSVAPVPFRADLAASAAAGALDVATLVPRRIASLIDMGSARFDLLKPPAGLVGHSLLSLERFVLPLLWDRVMAYPKIDEALYRKLAEMDRDAFLPGAETIPNDTILLLQTNPAFVESFLVGTNHEMGRELLWRGFPTDQRGTPFQKFWPYFDPLRRDIDPIHQWNASARLGEAGGEGMKPQLVLLIRGQLLRRYPNTNVYAVKKEAADGDTARFDGSRAFVQPVGAGLIPPDITFFLFPLGKDDVDKYWFVLEEPMTEPRFGFDDGAAPRQVPRVRRRGGKAMTRIDLVGDALPLADTWLDVDWIDLPMVAPGGHVTLAALDQVRLKLPEDDIQSATSHAGHVARALMQRPFRGYFAGARLKA